MEVELRWENCVDCVGNLSIIWKCFFLWARIWLKTLDIYVRILNRAGGRRPRKNCCCNWRFDNPWADPRFFLGGGAPLRNGVNDWWGKQIQSKYEVEGGIIWERGEWVRTFCTLPVDLPLQHERKSSSEWIEKLFLSSCVHLVCCIVTTYMQVVC